MPDTMLQSDAPPTENHSGGIAKLAGALALAQKNFAPIPKDREVTVTSDRGNYKFKYATLDAIRSATMPALAEQSLAVVQGMVETGNNGYGVETKLLHASGEWIRNVTPMFVSGRVKDGRQFPPTNQELGSAQSYARRYGLSALLCITADEDDDGNTADGNHIAGSERVPYKPARGMAGAGSQFRPEGRRMPTNNYSEDARHDGIVDDTRKKGELPAGKGPLGGREATAEQARAAKITAATDKRITALGSKSGWTKAELDDFWRENLDWIEWMRDAANKAETDWKRFKKVYDTYEKNARPVELA